MTLFIVSLIISGATAFAIETELAWVIRHFPGLNSAWFHRVFMAVQTTNDNFPFMAYGTDWLAFAHLVIAVAFIGPLRDPVRNIWVVQFGMIACLMVFPLAFICGPIRGIPFYWQLIDCAFGLFGFIPLYICHQKIKQLEYINLNQTL